MDMHTYNDDDFEAAFRHAHQPQKLPTPRLHGELLPATSPAGARTECEETDHLLRSPRNAERLRDAARQLSDEHERQWQALEEVIYSDHDLLATKGMDDNHLPTNPAARKGIPLAAGCLDYFPDALAEVARLSKFGNDKHNPGQPLHWSRDKSTDHADCIMRHMIDRGRIDPESGFLHDVMVAWRALAQLQLAIEARPGDFAAAHENTTVVPTPKVPFTYWYVATPYTNYQKDNTNRQAALDAAAKDAAIYTAEILKADIPAYSPIAHTHPIAVEGNMDKVDPHLWQRVDKPLLDSAGGIIVVQMQGWKESRGVQHEIAEMKAAGKPVIYWNPVWSLPLDVIKAAQV